MPPPFFLLLPNIILGFTMLCMSGVCSFFLAVRYSAIRMHVIRLIQKLVPGLLLQFPPLPQLPNYLLLTPLSFSPQAKARTRASGSQDYVCYVYP